MSDILSFNGYFGYGFWSVRLTNKNYCLQHVSRVLIFSGLRACRATARDLYRKSNMRLRVEKVKWKQRLSTGTTVGWKDMSTSLSWRTQRLTARSLGFRNILRRLILQAYTNDQSVNLSTCRRDFIFRLRNWTGIRIRLPQSIVKKEIPLEKNELLNQFTKKKPSSHLYCRLNHPFSPN